MRVNIHRIIILIISESYLWGLGLYSYLILLIGPDIVRICVLAHHYELMGIITIVSSTDSSFGYRMLCISIFWYQIRNWSAYVKISWLVCINLIITCHQVWNISTCYFIVDIIIRHCGSSLNVITVSHALMAP